MRGSTKLAIGGYVGWFIANLIANASAPTSLARPGTAAGRQFKEQIMLANTWQGIGSLLLLIAIVCTIVTIYKNIMDKSVNKTIHGDEITASGGATVATHGSSIAQGASTIVNTTIIDSEVSDIMGQITTLADQAALSDRDRRALDLITEKLTGDTSLDEGESDGYLDDILDIFKGSGEILSSVQKLVSVLRP